MTVQRFEYVGNAAPTTLATDLSIGGLSFTLTDFTGYPTGVVGRFTLAVNAPTPTTPGGATEETILCLTQSNGLVVVDPAGRGFDGTLPQTHSAGESVQVCWTAFAADLDNLHNSSTDNVHGVEGNVVGDSDEQTLVNKTIDGTLNTLVNVPASAIVGGGLTGQILDTNQSPPASGGGPISSAGPSAAPMSTTYATLTFAAPTSGNVKLTYAGLELDGADGFYHSVWWVDRATSATVGNVYRTTADDAASSMFKRPVVMQIVTGLTAGVTYTLDLWQQMNGGTGEVQIYDCYVEAVGA